MLQLVAGRQPGICKLTRRDKLKKSYSSVEVMAAGLVKRMPGELRSPWQAECLPHLAWQTSDFSGGASGFACPKSALSPTAAGLYNL
jgi:hypothetical protein